MANLTQLKALIVDGNENQRAGCRRAANSGAPPGFTFGFLEAETTEEALRLLAGQHFDLAIVELPESNPQKGLSLIRSLRAKSDTMVIISVSVSDKPGIDAVEAGANSHVGDWFDVNWCALLQQMVYTLVGKGRVLSG